MGEYLCNLGQYTGKKKTADGRICPLTRSNTSIKCTIKRYRGSYARHHIFRKYFDIQQCVNKISGDLY